MLSHFIFIYGPPASGKSVVSKRLAASLQCPVYDLDQEIELQAGKTIPDIFADEGEPGFRERETSALMEVADRPVGVVALGGGALIRSENRLLVEKKGQVVCLSASFETILERLGTGDAGRPLLDGDAQAKLQNLLAKRESHYASFPIQIDADNSSVDNVVWQIQTRLGCFRIKNMGPGYDVRLVDNGLNSLGELMLGHGLSGSGVVVSDENVARHYLPTVKKSLEKSSVAVNSIILPAGEENKSFHTVEQLLHGFAEGGLDRTSTVIALGGGVVGDLAGFAAAIYMRGIRWVTIPTSLLAMVDASLGGKTGVDLPQGKNLAGAFHPPELVLVDSQLLSTLPEIELRNGMAEVIKHAVLADPLLFERCCTGLPAVTADLDWIVRRAMAVKVKVIEEDPFEHGRRASLNLGHTLGHALELATEFRLKHGEAVGIGMVAAARLSEQMELAQPGLAAMIEQCLMGVGLPTRIPEGIDRYRLLEAMELDKKSRLGRPRIVLPQSIGTVRWGIELDDPAILIDVMG